MPPRKEGPTITLSLIQEYSRLPNFRTSRRGVGRLRENEVILFRTNERETEGVTNIQMTPEDKYEGHIGHLDTQLICKKEVFNYHKTY